MAAGVGDYQSRCLHGIEWGSHIVCRECELNTLLQKDKTMRNALANIKLVLTNIKDQLNDFADEMEGVQWMDNSEIQCSTFDAIRDNALELEDILRREDVFQK